jgi:hypothetical protein
MSKKSALSRMLAGFFGLVLLLLAIPQPAAAYVDPGSGALIWQIAAAAVFGSLFRMRRIVSWIRARCEAAFVNREKTTGARGPIG